MIVESLGSSCPYEYADGSDVPIEANKVMLNGVFTIKDATMVKRVGV